MMTTVAIRDGVALAGSDAPGSLAALLPDPAVRMWVDIESPNDHV